MEPFECCYCGAEARHAEPPGAWVPGIDQERSRDAGFDGYLMFENGKQTGWLCYQHLREHVGMGDSNAVATNDEGTEFEMDGITFVFES